MRFSAPRSLSPSPVRGKVRSRSTFGLQSGSEDSDYDSDSNSNSYSSSDSDSACSPSSGASTSASSSTDSFCYASDSDVPIPPPNPRRRSQNPAEQQYIEETVAAIRLRTRHNDPYEEWEKQTRKDAFRTARKELSATQIRLRDQKASTRGREQQRLAAIHAQQMAEVQAQLEVMRLKQQKDESSLREAWKVRDKKVWDRIESVIKVEEDKVKARLEQERKLREEEERVKNEAELKRKLAEEKKRQEEEERQRKEQEERILKAEEQKREEEDERQRLEDERIRTERLQSEEAQRQKLGITTSDEDWKQARANLRRLKTDTMQVIKSDKAAKSEWGTYRRKITPKIGQITNDSRAINDIFDQLILILHPTDRPPHHEKIYTALLYSLAKAILLQAETEVTAEKRSAIPLAQVAFKLLEKLDGFAEIFFAKLTQRVGGWPIPAVIPTTDHDGTQWGADGDRIKAMGYRKSQIGEGLETTGEYTARISGIMRLYFHILKIEPTYRPLHPMFQLPRYWVWVSRLMDERGLLETAIAPHLLYTALDVLGSHARELWGHQWNKMLELIYEGVTVGFGNGRQIGGQSPEGTGARLRVQFEVERIVVGHA
ncbi:GLE1-like protein-domain-containing protein [Collybia nuda]|uniref:mRNA export factor GLE1 n=1 Tax=Collybia nuda TaxID=64659 RepID=A0A9P5XWK2_9AGAR|nr:GLE1-like protein-domain-containing protein [Collybia nuda]